MARIGLGSRIGQHIIMSLERTSHIEPDAHIKPQIGLKSRRRADMIREKPLLEKIAEKIRDLRFRRSLTGTMDIQRLTRKTNPKDVQHLEEIDFETAVATYKHDIEQDIRAYKACS